MTPRTSRAIQLELGRIIHAYMGRKVSAGLAAAQRAMGGGHMPGAADVDPADALACARLEGALDALLWALGVQDPPSGAPDQEPIDMTIIAGVAQETPASAARRQAAEEERAGDMDLALRTLAAAIRESRA